MARADSHDARAIALRALGLFRREGIFVQGALDQIARERTVSSADLALATELALGVMRHRLTLRHLLSHFLRGRWAHFKPELRDVLLLGAYQLVFLERVPDFSAVNKTVELAKGLGGRRAAGLTNAVLRELLRHRQPDTLDPAAAELTHRIEVGTNQCVAFDIAILPDPDEDLVAHISLAMSHPAWLVRRWLKWYGRDRTVRICRYGTSRPEVFLRPNRLRVSPEDLLARLDKENADVSLDTERGLIHWRSGPPLTHLQAFGQGLFQPQDPTAKSVVDLAGLQPHQTILDLCAGPGTKCTYAAELMKDRGVIVAADRTEARIALVDESARRLGLSIIRTCLASEVASRLLHGSAPDVVFVDVPCSNTGVLARRPEARYRLRPDRLKKLARKQQELLGQAAELAGPKTRIIYSTCSIEKEENESVIESFCHRHGNFRVQDSRLVLPNVGKTPIGWHDGGFAAVLAQESANK